MDEAYTSTVYTKILCTRDGNISIARANINFICLDSLVQKKRVETTEPQKPNSYRQMFFLIIYFLLIHILITREQTLYADITGLSVVDGQN